MNASQASAPKPRRSGDATRALIEHAAQALFREQGYGAVTIRDIAKRAEVDPAVVIRHFGSKERLFVATMPVEDNLGPLDDVPLDRMGAEIVRRVLDFPAATRDDLRETIRAADRPEIRLYLRTVMDRNLIGPLAARLDGSDARARAALVSAQVLGLLMQLGVLAHPEVADLDEEDLVLLYGRGIQAVIDGPSAAGEPHAG